MQVVDALLGGFICSDLDGAGGGDSYADGHDAGHQRPEGGAEDEEGAVLEGVDEDLVAVEREAGFLDLLARWLASSLASKRGCFLWEPTSQNISAKTLATACCRIG